MRLLGATVLRAGVGGWWTLEAWLGCGEWKFTVPRKVETLVRAGK